MNEEINKNTLDSIMSKVHVNIDDSFDKERRFVYMHGTLGPHGTDSETLKITAEQIFKAIEANHEIYGLSDGVLKFCPMAAAEVNHWIDTSHMVGKIQRDFGEIRGDHMTVELDFGWYENVALSLHFSHPKPVEDSEDVGDSSDIEDEDDDTFIAGTNIRIDIDRHAARKIAAGTITALTVLDMIGNVKLGIKAGRFITRRTNNKGIGGLAGTAAFIALQMISNKGWEALCNSIKDRR